MINRLSISINRNRSAAKISKVMSSSVYGQLRIVMSGYGVVAGGLWMVMSGYGVVSDGFEW